MIRESGDNKNENKVLWCDTSYVHLGNKDIFFTCMKRGGVQTERKCSLRARCSVRGARSSEQNSLFGHTCAGLFRNSCSES